MPPNRAWLQLIPDAVVVVDEQGRIDFANSRCESLFGYKPSELIGQPIEILIPERFSHHAERRTAYMQDPTLRPMGASLDLVARHRSGEEIAVDVSLRPIDIDGKRHVVASVRDMREQRELLQTMRLQSIALDASASGVMITDAEGKIRWVNPAACRMSGYSADELVGQSTRMLKSGAHPPEFYRELWETILAGNTWHGVITNRHKDGSLYHEEQTISPVRSDRGEITHFIAVRQDITARVQAEQALRAARDELAERVVEVERLHAQLREQAIRDPLTGLFNRRYLDETLSREIVRAHRTGVPLVIAMLDLDHFKRINDTEGHAFGDKFLAALGEMLAQRSRSDDVACRYGGEEFVIVLSGATIDVALRRAEEWRRAFAAIEIEGKSGPVHATLSVGLAALTPDETASALFLRADAAVYDAKHSGRNRTAVAAPPPATAERPDPSLLRVTRTP